MVVALDGKSGSSWSIFHGDSAEIVTQLPASSIDFSIYSPPFGDLFTYSDSERDLGNCATKEEFFTQYGFIIKGIFDATKAGRITAVHCTDLPTRKWKDGYIGTDPFSDDISRAHVAAGWQFLRRVTIWKDPVVEMTRTKALNLLHKQILKDSTCSWPGSPDYLMVFRKPGDNAVRVGHKPANFPVHLWQKIASPVWMDINQTDVLNNKSTALKWIGDPISLDDAAHEKDEKHLCPLQCSVIERALLLWSNPGDVVLSPFAGIGSEGVVAIRRDRKFVGVELHAQYYRQAVRAVTTAESNNRELQF